MTRKITHFAGWPWFKFNNLRLTLGIAFKILQQYGQRVKTKIQNVLGANSYVCRSYRGKTGRETFFARPPSWIGLRKRYNFKLNPTKAHGFDNISIQMIQLHKSFILLTVAQIFKSSLKQYVFLLLIHGKWPMWLLFIKKSRIISGKLPTNKSFANICQIFWKTFT